MTEKMEGIRSILERIITERYNPDDLETILTGAISIGDVVNQIFVECCRYAYLINSEKHPMSYYIEQDGKELDLTRKQLRRTIDYVDASFEVRKEIMKSNFGVDLIAPEHEIKTEKGRYPAYELTRFQYWEINNIHDMSLVRAIADDRIGSTKKIDNYTLLEYVKEYDEEMAKHIKKSEEGEEELVFRSLVFFTLETIYSFEFFYKIVKEMEKQNKKAMDFGFCLHNLTAKIKFPSYLHKEIPNLVSEEDCLITYPMIMKRDCVIPAMIDRQNDFILQMACNNLMEANILANSVQSHFCLGNDGTVQMRQWFAENTSMEDWASFFKEYNIFEIYVKDKDWTPKCLRFLRRLYDFDEEREKIPKNVHR